MTKQNPETHCNDGEAHVPSLWTRVRTKFLDSTEHRTWVFACLLFPALLTWVVGFSNGMLTANRHAFSGCLSDPGTMALWMDAFGYYLAVSARACLFTVFFTAFLGVVYFVLDSIATNVVGFCKGTVEVCTDVYRGITTPKPKRPVVTEYDLAVHARSWFQRTQDRVLCMTAWVIQNMWFMVLMNFLVSCLAAGILYVISAPQVCYSNSTVGYSIGIYCVLFIGLMFIPIQVALSMSFGDYQRRRDLCVRMSFHVASVFARMQMFDRIITRSYVSPDVFNGSISICFFVMGYTDKDDTFSLRWREPLRFQKRPTREICYAELYIELDAWSNTLTFTYAGDNYGHLQMPKPLNVNVRELTVDQLFDTMIEFQANVDAQHAAYIATLADIEQDIEDDEAEDDAEEGAEDGESEEDPCENPEDTENEE